MRGGRADEERRGVWTFGRRKGRNAMSDAPGSDDRTVTEYEVQDVEKANATGKQPVVFVHGLWLLPNSWDRGRGVFEEAGYATAAPGRPHDPTATDGAKAHPEGLQTKSLRQLAAHDQQA